MQRVPFFCAACRMLPSNMCASFGAYFNSMGVSWDATKPTCHGPWPCTIECFMKHLPKQNIWKTPEIMQKKSVWKKMWKKTPEPWNHPQKNALMASWCTATPFGFDSAMYGGFSKDPMGCANPEKSSEGDMMLDEQFSRWYYLKNSPLKFKTTLLKLQST